MKTRHLIPLLLIFVSTALGLSIQWDSNKTTDQVTSYNVYEHAGTLYTLLGTVSSPAPSPAKQTWPIPSPIPAGPHVYTITALNVRGENVKVPGTSETTLPDVPTAPVGVVLVP